MTFFPKLTPTDLVPYDSHPHIPRDASPTFVLPSSSHTSTSSSETMAITSSFSPMSSARLNASDSLATNESHTLPTPEPFSFKASSTGTAHQAVSPQHLMLCASISPPYLVFHITKTEPSHICTNRDNYLPLTSYVSPPSTVNQFSSPPPKYLPRQFNRSSHDCLIPTRSSLHSPTRLDCQSPTICTPPTNPSTPSALQPKPISHSHNLSTSTLAPLIFLQYYPNPATPIPFSNYSSPSPIHSPTDRGFRTIPTLQC